MLHPSLLCCVHLHLRLHITSTSDFVYSPLFHSSGAFIAAFNSLDPHRWPGAVLRRPLGRGARPPRTQRHPEEERAVPVERRRTTLDQLPDELVVLLRKSMLSKTQRLRQ